MEACGKLAIMISYLTLQYLYLTIPYLSLSYIVHSTLPYLSFTSNNLIFSYLILLRHFILLTMPYTFLSFIVFIYLYIPKTHLLKSLRQFIVYCTLYKIPSKYVHNHISYLASPSPTLPNTAIVSRRFRYVKPLCPRVHHHLLSLSACTRHLKGLGILRRCGIFKWTAFLCFIAHPR